MIIKLTHQIIRNSCIIFTDDSAIIDQIVKLFRAFFVQKLEEYKISYDIAVYKNSKKYRVEFENFVEVVNFYQAIGYVSRHVLKLLGRDNAEYFLLHGAGICKNGGVYCFLGKTKSGKSTLIYTLCNKFGFTYLTDDLLCVNKEGMVVSFPKPIFLRNLSHSYGIQEQDLDIIEYENEKRYCLLPEKYEKIENSNFLKTIFIIQRKPESVFSVDLLTSSDGFLELWKNMFTSDRLLEKRHLSIILAKKTEIYNITYSDIDTDYNSFLNLIE